MNFKRIVWLAMVFCLFFVTAGESQIYISKYKLDKSAIDNAKTVQLVEVSMDMPAMAQMSLFTVPIMDNKDFKVKLQSQMNITLMERVIRNEFSRVFGKQLSPLADVAKEPSYAEAIKTKGDRINYLDSGNIYGDKKAAMAMVQKLPSDLVIAVRSTLMNSSGPDDKGLILLNGVVQIQIFDVNGNLIADICNSHDMKSFNEYQKARKKVDTTFGTGPLFIGSKETKAKYEAQHDEEVNKLNEKYPVDPALIDRAYFTSDEAIAISRMEVQLTQLSKDTEIMVAEALDKSLLKK